jgi:hypothetical protein
MSDVKGERVWKTLGVMRRESIQRRTAEESGDERKWKVRKPKEAEK